MNSFVLALVVLLAVASTVQGFSTRSFVRSTRVVSGNRQLQMADVDEPVARGQKINAEVDEQNLSFDMNRRVRLGRSRDQDGKSNIWSIEPAMQVVEEEEGESAVGKNLLIGGVVIGAALACLPLFNAFSSIFPDPADF